MPTPLSTAHRNRLQAITTEARETATAICRTALENLAVHEGDYRPHMTVEQRQLRNRLRARGRALGDARDVRTGRQEIRKLADDAAYEHWHRLLFTRFLAENHLLITDEANGSVPVTLEECEELASELGAKDGFDLACRFASTMLPGVFRRDDPILELNFPANDRKKLRELLDSIPQDVFTASDSLGWTYQFWQTKRKQEVNESGKKIGADELAPVTQLFTEDYMVDFLLDNTLGAWWAGKKLTAENAKNSEFKNEEEVRQFCALSGCLWKYLRFIQGEDGKWTPAAGTFEGWPKSAKELKCLDPCMGSGHFVVAMFERLVALRLAEERSAGVPPAVPSGQDARAPLGNDEAAAVAAVIRDNLFGLEIDPRCTQIAAFNLALAAWRRVGYCKLPPMNLACSGLAPNASEKDWVALAGDNHKLQRGMERLYRLFKNAPVLGSLINPRQSAQDMYVADYHELADLLSQALSQESPSSFILHNSSFESAVTARGLAKAAEILADQFTLVATNVPYLGRGKQDEVLTEYCDRVHPDAKADLATCFVERCLEFCAKGSSTVLVTPQNWLFLATYQSFRKQLLANATFQLIAELGAGAFQTPLYDFSFALFLATNLSSPTDFHYASLVASGSRALDQKVEALSNSACFDIAAKSVRSQSDCRILTQPIDANSKPLSAIAAPNTGLQTGDNDHYSCLFWEQPNLLKGWEFFHRTSQETLHFGGRCRILFWEDGNGALVADDGSAVRGLDCRGKRGVLVHRMGDLPATLFTGEMFDQNGAAIIPVKDECLAAVWCFLASDSYRVEVRKLDNKVGVTPATLAKIPFDLAHWQKVAAEKYPHGLPKPYTDDPTQWLFDGHPARNQEDFARLKDDPATRPLLQEPDGSLSPVPSARAPFVLQVAVARLLGYQWPRQTGSSFPDCPALGPDGLEKFADDDGIVCLAPLNREQPAATRLRALLHAAMGTFDERDLIRKSGPKGSTKTSLEDWLRDDFFAQHCALFHSRPFIWHLWDGLKDGFHALVNYHRLDHAKLQKLAYTYLGDWIHDQKAAAEADTPGAAERLGAAKALQAALIAILAGEAPLDLFIRWKPLHQQPIGWHPDLNDGVRQNIRPFLLAGDVGAKGAGLFRAKPGIDPKAKPDRGTEPHRAKADYPWFWCAEDPGTDPVGGKEFVGRRWNTAHFTLARKQAARAGAK